MSRLIDVVITYVLLFIVIDGTRITVFADLREKGRFSYQI